MAFRCLPYNEKSQRCALCAVYWFWFYPQSASMEWNSTNNISYKYCRSLHSILAILKIVHLFVSLGGMWLMGKQQQQKQQTSILHHEFVTCVAIKRRAAEGREAAREQESLGEPGTAKERDDVNKRKTAHFVIWYSEFIHMYYTQHNIIKFQFCGFCFKLWIENEILFGNECAVVLLVPRIFYSFLFFPLILVVFLW